MKKNLKKIMALSICLIFLLTIGNSVIGIEIDQGKNKKEVKNESITKTVTLYRHGLDGKVKPVEVVLDLSDNEDLEMAIEEKCKELFKTDKEFSDYLNEVIENYNDSNITSGVGLYFVLSRGKGIHFQTKMTEKLILRHLMNKFKIPKFLINLFVKIRTKSITCIYRNNLAFSSVQPIINLIGNNTNGTTIKGPHTISMGGFKGYTGWYKRVKFSMLFGRTICGFCKGYALIE